jgi:phage terminase large subunit-like protein
MRRQSQSKTTSPDSRQPVRSPDKDCLEHFERFCRHLTLPDTLTPLILEDYQRQALADYFQHGALEHLWLWPTGAGKSTLLGALVLHHGTFVRVNPRVIILGGLGGHGKHTLRAAAWFISQNETLKKWWVAQEYGMGRIKSLIRADTAGVIEVSSAGRRIGGRGGSSQEGEGPSLVVVEELHRHEDDGAAVRTLTTKVQKRTLGAHRVRILHVTTAGDSLESPLGRLVKRATGSGAHIEQPSAYFTRAQDADGDLVMHRWAVPEFVELPAPDATTADVNRFLAQVKAANPASFINQTNLRRSWKASSAEPWIFARQHCNQWVTAHAAAFTRYDWAQCKREGLAIPKGAHPVFVGIDTATAFATTAIIPVWINDQGEPCTAGGVILKSEHRGTKRRMRNVIDVLEVMRQRWPQMVAVFDRNWGGGLIAEQFEEDYGMTVIDHSQAVPMEFASMLLGELVAQHELRHDGDEQITAQVLAATAKTTYYGKRWRLEKPRSGEPIDAAVALAMAVNAAKQDSTTVRLNIDDYRIERL